MGYLDQLDPNERKNYREFTLHGYLQGAFNDFRIKEGIDNISEANLKIKNIIFTGNANFKGEILWNEITFEDCYFQKDINFTSLSLKSTLRIVRCFCDGELYIYENTSFEKEFSLIDFNVQRQIYVKGGKFDICRWSVSNSATVKIAGGEFRELNIGYWGGANIKYLLIDLNAKMSGLIKITGQKSFIQELLINKSNSEVSISIEDVNVNLLNIHYFRNDKQFRINSIKAWSDANLPPAEISILYSYLGKAEFYDIDFSNFNFINIYSSHFSDSSFINVIWKDNLTSFKGRGIHLNDDEKDLPKKIKQFEDAEWKDDLIDDPSIKSYFLNMRETYRQLKYVYSKQGDSINEQKFHSKEMLAYKNTITLDNDFFTKCIVYFSHWFSDFGQSVARPLKALLIGHFLLVVILIWAGGIQNLEINLSEPNSAGFKDAFEKYFYYLNPLRRNTDDFKGYYVLFDVGMRIWSSYMIYNLIRATRRFIK